MGERIGRVFFTLKVMRFEEKETHGEKKDEGICGCTKTQFPQDGPEFPTGAAGDTLRSLSCGEEITKEKTGANDQKNFDGKASYQLFGWR
ncbi:MAG: hypothetical protein ACXU93_02855, partial [Thermodesulfobacteriota bacterium]